MSSRLETKGIIYRATGAIGWGLPGAVGARLVANYGLDASWVTAVRMLLSGLVLIAVAAPKSGAKLLRRFPQPHGYAVAAGLSPCWGLLLCQYTYLAAIEHSNSATATVLQSLNVVMMAVVMAVWTRRMLTRSQVLALILALAGTFLIATHGNPSEMVLYPAQD